MIDEIRRLAGDDSHLTINEMEVETGMISGTIEWISFKHLKLRKKWQVVEYPTSWLICNTLSKSEYVKEI